MGTGGTSTSSSTTTTSSVRSVARDRLSVILASQRGSVALEGVNMQALQTEIMQVVKVRAMKHHSNLVTNIFKWLMLIVSLSNLKKHITIAKEGAVQMELNHQGDVSLFEISVELEGIENRSPGNSTMTNVTVKV